MTTTTDRGVVTGLSICVDCLVFTANGDLPEDPARAAELTDAAERLHDEGYVLVPACPEDCEGSFSRSSCDGCGSTLGGDRHPGALIPVAAPSLSAHLAELAF